MQKPLAGICLGSALITFPAVRMIALERVPKPGFLVPENDSVTSRDRSTDSKSPSPSTASFRVVNRGGSIVQINAVKSGCDCAVPRVEPKIVEPGAVAVVEIVPEPPEFGERTVVVTLVTDSPVTPEVPLRLQMKAREHDGESYLLRAGNPLVYMGDWSPDEPRQIIATTVQAPGEEKPPQVTCDLPFLKFELIDVVEKTSTDPSVAFRNYTYRPTFTSYPPQGRFEGQAKVLDPWNHERSQIIRIHGQTPEPLQIIPPRLILRVNPDNDGQDPVEAVLRLKVRNPELSPSIVVENPETSPLLVRPVESDENQLSSYVVAIKGDPTKVVEGVTSLVVRSSASSSQKFIVPVMIRKE